MAKRIVDDTDATATNVPANKRQKLNDGSKKSEKPSAGQKDDLDPVPNLPSEQKEDQITQSDFEAAENATSPSPVRQDRNEAEAMNDIAAVDNGISVSSNEQLQPESKATSDAQAVQDNDSVSSTDQVKTEADTADATTQAKKSKKSTKSTAKNTNASKARKSPAPQRRAAAASNAKGKANVTDVETAAPEPPKPKRINKALRNKVIQIGTFMDKHPDSYLTRSTENVDHVIVTESALIGALMAMCADWDISDPLQANRLDAEEAIVREFDQLVGDHMIKHVLIDLSVRTTFVDAIQLRIAGHGLHDINLLEIELEMYHRQLIEVAGMNLYNAMVAAASFSDDDDDDGDDDGHSEKEEEGDTSGFSADTEATELTVESEKTDEGEKIDEGEKSMDVANGAKNETRAENEKTLENQKIVKSKKAEKVVISSEVPSNSEKEVDSKGVCPAPLKVL